MGKILSNTTEQPPADTVVQALIPPTEPSHTDFFGPLPDDAEQDSLLSVYHTLAFVSRALEMHADSPKQDEFSSEELSGLTAICRLMMKEVAGCLVQP